MYSNRGDRGGNGGDGSAVMLSRALIGGREHAHVIFNFRSDSGEGGCFESGDLLLRHPGSEPSHLRSVGREMLYRAHARPALPVS